MNESYKPLPPATMQEIKDTIDKHERAHLFGKTLAGVLKSILVVAAIAVLLAVFLIPVFRVYGGSMSPTLNNGQVIVSFRSANFEKGDIIAFYYGNKILLKRVIAEAGDLVEIDSQGNVSVNGEVLDEPYVYEKSLGECDLAFPYQVPDSRWFVMGDHRSTSVDSRSSLVGAISEEQIVGRVVLKVWPIGDFGIVD